MAITPAFLAFRFACLESDVYQREPGRPRKNLHDTIMDDLSERGIEVNNVTDFYNLVHTAMDRVKWKSL